MTDEIPSFDVLDEGPEDRGAQSPEPEKPDKAPKSRVFLSLVACVITGGLMAAGFIAVKGLTPEKGPDARVLAAKIISQVKKARSASFHGNLKLRTDADFIPVGKVMEIAGKFGPGGFAIEVDDSFAITRTGASMFMNINSEWVRIPIKTNIKKTLSDSVAHPDEAQKPVRFGVSNLKGRVIEGPVTGGRKTWEMKIDPLSLFGNQAYRMAPALAGTKAEVLVDQNTSLPISADIDWSGDANSNIQLTRLGMGADLALTLHIEFSDWGKAQPVKPPKTYRDIEDFAFSKDGVNIG